MNLKRKAFIPMIAVLTSVMSFSIGFSMWNISANGDRATAIIDFDADAIAELPDPTQLMTFSIPNFTAREGYGFLSDNSEYVDSHTFVCPATFDRTKAANAVIQSISDSCFSFKIDITFPTLSSKTQFFTLKSNITTSDGIGSSSVFVQTVGNQTVDFTNDNETILQYLNISSVPSGGLLSFNFNISLRFTGESLSSFPNLKDNKLKIKITPGEYLS